MSRQPQNQDKPPKEKEEMHRYEVMLQSAPPDYLTNIQEPIRELPPRYPMSYFFYGTLTNPATLQRILDLHDEPKLRKADIIGYALAKWCDYPALIDGQQDQVVSGSVYAV